MAWKKTETILNIQLNRRGLAPMVAAGLLCQEAERRYPGQFKAVSLRASTLHVTVSHSQLLAFKLIQGKLLSELQLFTKEHSLPHVARIRLTITDDFSIL